MDELKSIILKQDKVLEVIETKLSNVINRIEDIERKYRNTSFYHLNHNDPVFSTEKEQNIERISPHSLLNSETEINFCSLERTNTSLNSTSQYKLDNCPGIKNIQNENNSFKNMEQMIKHETKVTNNILKSPCKFSNDKESNHTNADEETKIFIFHESIGKFLRESSFDTVDKTSDRLVKRDEEARVNLINKSDSVNNENDAIIANSNILEKTVIVNARSESKYSDNRKGSDFNWPIKVNSLKLETIYDRRNIDVNSTFSSIIGKGTSMGNTSNQHYIFDDEDNTNAIRDGPLDLESAENEFYYLRRNIQRGSTTSWDKYCLKKTIDGYSIQEIYSPSTERIPRTGGMNCYGIIGNNKCIVKEIKYHKPFEKTIGYVQIPYKIRNQLFENELNNREKNISPRREKVTYFRVLRNDPHLNNKFNNFHNIHYQRAYNNFKENMNFYRIVYHSYPIAILGPMLS
ncbi:hypothetical protein HWI79_3287 [Cryptosporidium felis]|nr:hypothetical protein HWI79_3287 [Cryptosporidium felis]